MRDNSPQNWQLDIPQDRIDLYLELLERPRTLTEDEARMMVELVNAWRTLEHEKHIAHGGACQDVITNARRYSPAASDEIQQPRKRTEAGVSR